MVIFQKGIRRGVSGIVGTLREWFQFFWGLTRLSIIKLRSSCQL